MATTKEYLLKVICDDAGIKQFTDSTKQMGMAVKDVTARMQTAGSTAGSYGEAISKLVSRAALVVPVWTALRFAIGGVEQIFQSSIKFMIDWETEMAKIRSITGASTSQIEALSVSLLDISDRFAVSSKDVASTANELLRTGTTLNTLNPMLEATAKLSKISGESMSESAKAVNSILSSFNLNANETSSAIDKLIAIQEKSGVSLNVLQEAFQKVGLEAKHSGITFDELAGYITAINQKSRDSGDLIGTQLRKMFVSLSSGAVDTIQHISGVSFYLDELGHTTTTQTSVLRNMDQIIKELANSWENLSNAQQADLAKALGGTRNVTSIIALLSNYNEAVKATAEATHATGDANKVLAPILNDTASHITSLQNTWDRFIKTTTNTSVVKSFLDTTKTGVEFLTEAVVTLQYNWAKMFNPTAFKEMQDRAATQLTNDQNAFLTGPRRNVVNKEKSSVQSDYITDLLTEGQIKQKIFDIEKNAISTREDALITAQKEQELYTKADGEAEKSLISEIQSNELKIEKLQIQKQIESAQENEVRIEAQMKAEGASNLQIEIQKLGYLEAINATSKEISKQQEKVDTLSIEQYKLVQDEIIAALTSEQKLRGDTDVQILENKINLEDQLGIHKRGIDLLKEQLELYKSIYEQANKTPQERLKELEANIKKVQASRQGPQGAQLEAQQTLDIQRALQSGFSSAQINAILYPLGKISQEQADKAKERQFQQNQNAIYNPYASEINGGVNSLQDILMKGLSDPLGKNLDILSKTIAELAEKITGNDINNLNTNISNYALPEERTTLPVLGREQAITGNHTVTINLGGITITHSADIKEELKRKLTNELAEIIAIQLVTHGSKPHGAAKNVIENY